MGLTEFLSISSLIFYVFLVSLLDNPKSYLATCLFFSWYFYICIISYCCFGWLEYDLFGLFGFYMFFFTFLSNSLKKSNLSYKFFVILSIIPNILIWHTLFVLNNFLGTDPFEPETMDLFCFAYFYIYLYIFWNL